MIHQPLGGFQGQATDIEIHAKEILLIREKLNKILAHHTGQDLARIEQDTDRDNFMSGEQSVAYGLVDQTKKRYGVAFKKDLPWEAMREVAQATKAVLRQKGFGQQLDAILNDPMEQLLRAVEAIYESWNTPRARRYREIKGMCHTWHSAAIVQEMAFGNRANEAIEAGMDETTASLTGVIPRTQATPLGLREFAGEVKFSAAGDDLVGREGGDPRLREQLALSGVPRNHLQLASGEGQDAGHQLPQAAGPHQHHPVGGLQAGQLEQADPGGHIIDGKRSVFFRGVAVDGRQGLRFGDHNGFGIAAILGAGDHLLAHTAMRHTGANCLNLTVGFHP